MSGFTPGPWAIDPLGVECIGDISTADGSQCVAQAQQIAGDTPKQEKRLANTRLIAAAPDLLEACQFVALALNGRVHSIQALKAVAMAREAVASALGEGERS